MSHPSSGPAPVDLQVMGILSDRATADLVERVIARAAPRDEVSVAIDLAEGLSHAVASAADVIFIDIGLGHGAGVAAVHHIRALIPRATIYALAQSDTLQLGTQAIALGANGLLMLPLSGDEILSAVADARARETERRASEDLTNRARWLDRGVDLLSRTGELTQARNRRDAASRFCELVTEHVHASGASAYLPATDGARQLKQVARVGAPVSLPPFCDEMDLLSAANTRDLTVLKLAIGREAAGFLVLAGLPKATTEEVFPLAGLVATQAASALALLTAREQSHRGAMKDPASSAYTFAYFVDIAGREIDKSRRHGRRFALATINVEPSSGVPPPPAGQRAIEVVERVLGTVRATDILARVDEEELYLLLPETGGIGGHVCRRRVLRNLTGAGSSEGAAPLDVTLGVAMYPLNGTDLSHLLRVAKSRADASRTSVVRTLALARFSLAEILDVILWDLSAPGSGRSLPETPQMIELPAIDVLSLAIAALNDARRGGGARAVATVRPGVSIGAAVRSAIGREAGEVQLDLVDIADAPGCRDLDAFTLIAEHSCYLFLGRVERGYVRGIHAADPLLVDVVTQRLGEAARTRLVD
ncbi:MAG: response regulator [Polyangiaceae bacterium]|nr:response regulator [Polyangiaceae bacterium]